MPGLCGIQCKAALRAARDMLGHFAARAVTDWTVAVMARRWRMPLVAAHNTLTRRAPGAEMLDHRVTEPEAAFRNPRMTGP